MAQRVHQGDCSVALRDAHNATHSDLVDTGTHVHSDGPEYDAEATGSPARCPPFDAGAASAPNSSTTAAQFLLDFKTWFNTYHRTMADLVTGELWYAHKEIDAAHEITGTMGEWEDIEAALLEATRLLLNDICSKYEAHRTNSGGTWHTSIDTLNNIGTPVTFTFGQYTAQIGIERTNYVKALFNDHIVKQGGTHSAADSGNVVSTANALYDVDTGPDWTGWIALLNALRTAMIAHTPTVVHANPDNTNVVSVAAVTIPSGTFDLATEIIADWNAHVASTTYHHLDDSAHATTVMSVTTVAHMIALAAELWQLARDHAREAPLSRSIRLIA